MSHHVVKCVGSELDLTLDWHRSLLEPGEAVDGGLEWRVLPSGDAGDLAVASQSCGRFQSAAVLKGGRAGQVYMVCAQVETTRARVIERAIVVRIAA